MNYLFSSIDERCLEMLQGFLPDKIFDAHTHAYDADFMPNIAAPTDSVFKTPDGIPNDYDVFIKYQGSLYQNAKSVWVNCLILPDIKMSEPGSTLRSEAVDYIVSQLNKHKKLIAAVPAIPGDRKETLLGLLRHERIRGFKVYHTMSKTKPTFNADAFEFIPEAAWEVCNELSLFLTVHLVKSKALSDKKNMEYIKAMCRRYPNAKLILAHGARSFAPWTVIESINELRQYTNAFFDLSSLCEPQSTVEIIRTVGISRVMWGSDYPISMLRGKCVSIADSFVWLSRNNLDLNNSGVECELTLVGIEQLMAFKQACHLLRLSKSDIEDLFYNNALNIFDVSDKTAV